jgi:hypothetical protein
MRDSPESLIAFQSEKNMQRSTQKRPVWFSTLLLTSTGMVSALFMHSVQADQAPGEDTITLHNRVNFNMLPVNTPARSATSTNPQEIPAWLDAKLARYQAKAYSADTTGIVTEKDVTTTIANDGMRKTCTQDIASNVGTSTTASNRLGIKSDPQIVVMRGDLVNICK